MILLTTYRQNNGICGVCVNEAHWERYGRDPDYRARVEAEGPSSTLTLSFAKKSEIPRLVQWLDGEFSFTYPDRVASALKRLDDLKLNRQQTLTLGYKSHGFNRTLNITVHCLHLRFYVVEVRCRYKVVRKLYRHYQRRQFWQRLQWQFNFWNQEKKYSLDCRFLEP